MELVKPFAEKGDRQDFPVDIQGDGSMSLQQGFGSFYALPPEEGGLFIERTKFNQLMYMMSKGVIDNKTAITSINKQLETITPETQNKVTNLNVGITYKVGTGGDFTTLNQALVEVGKYSMFGNSSCWMALEFVSDLTENVELNGFFAPKLIISFEGFKLTGNMNLYQSKIGIIQDLNIDNPNADKQGLSLNASYTTCNFSSTNTTQTQTIKSAHTCIYLDYNSAMNFTGNLALQPASNKNGIEIRSCSNFLMYSSVPNMGINQTTGTYCLAALSGGRLIAYAPLTGTIKATNIPKSTLSAEGGFIYYQ